MKPKEYYLNLRRQYEPKPAKLVIVAESPPATGLYFYDQAGKPSEPLFAALMKQLNFTAPTKQDGLTELKRRGWVLVDATYEPVDKHSASGRRMSISNRNKVIERDYDQLRNDLKNLISDRSTPLILIKANVCRALKGRLADDGFNVLNGETIIPFPSTGQQTKFHQEFGSILKRSGILK